MPLTGPLLAPQQALTALKGDSGHGTDLLAWRYGSARLESDFQNVAVFNHLRSRRYLRTADGQRFFLRFADTRSLLALWSVLDPGQRRCLMGPIAQWTVEDYEGVAVTLEADPSIAAAPEITLSDESLEALMADIWPWSLLAAAEEVDESIAVRKDDAKNLPLCRAAAAWARASRCPYPVEIVYAVGLIRSQGVATEDEQFAGTLQEATRSGDTSLALQWAQTHYPELSLAK